MALSYSVDYWDYLGWRDRFAKSEFVERQTGYREHLSNRNLYTPQMVVDGRQEAPGSRQRRVRRMVNDRMNLVDAGPKIGLLMQDDQVEVTLSAMDGHDEPADVWLVSYMPEPFTEAISGGENRGANMQHHNLVTHLVHLGAWSGEETAFSAPALSGRNYAVLVQQANIGPVLSAAWIEARETGSGGSNAPSAQ